MYVVDEQGRLAGVVPTRDLLVSGGDTPIATLVPPKVVSLPSDATVFDACEFFMQYRYLALPVVDGDGRLLGTVDVNLVSDEVFNLAEQQARDDVFQLIGIHVLRNQRFAPWANFRDRFPWLVANIVGGTLCALLSSRFENLLAAVIAVALFVPIVLTLAESVSIQSMSIALQSLRASTLAPRALVRAVLREFAVAVLLGAASGASVGLVAWVWLGSVKVGLAVATSILLALIVASLLGLVLPVVVRAVRADPRVAAGPIVLATTDVVTLAFYFTVSRQFLAA